MQSRTAFSVVARSQGFLFDKYMISKPLLKELDQILQEDYNLKLSEAKLADFAEFLVSYFQTLIDIKMDCEKKAKHKCH